MRADASEVPQSQSANDERSSLLARRPYALSFTLLVAAITDLSLLWLYRNGGMGADFAVFWRAVRSPAPYAYSPLPFGNPPTALLLLEPLKLLPLRAAFVAWDIVALAAFLSLGSRLYGRTTALLASISPAVVLGIVAGQMSLLVGALILGAFLAGPILCGVLLGLALCAKPQMVFLAPFLFLFAREFRPLIALCVTVGLLAAATTLAFGPSIWTEWITGMHNLLFVAKQRGAIFLTISPTAFKSWLAAFSFPASLLAIFNCRDRTNADRAAAIIAASLFAAPYSMIYDLAPLSLFASAVILRSSDWKGFSAALAYSGAMGPFSIPCLWATLWPAARSSDVRRAELASVTPHLDFADPVCVDPLPPA